MSKLTARPVVQAWLRDLHRRVNPDDLSPELSQTTLGWLEEYQGSFRWLIECRDRLHRVGSLSPAQVVAVLNWWRADLRAAGWRRRARVAKAEGVDVHTLPEGHYAVRHADEHVVFYRVEHGRGRWTGHTFLQQVVGGGRAVNLGRVAPARRYFGPRRLDLATIVSDPEQALRLFGRELGICGVCGRMLTDDESRAAGIGPICAGRDLGIRQKGRYG